MSIRIDPFGRRRSCRRIILARLFGLGGWLLAAALYGAGAPHVQILHLEDDGQLHPGLPPEVLIGEDFHFKLKVSPDPSLPVGYAPFVELYLQYDGANCTQPLSGHCDGLKFGGANAEFTTTVLPLTSCPAGTPFVFGVNPSCSAAPQCAGTTSTAPTSCFFGTAPPTCVTESVAGFQKVVLPLPFGSFAFNQPPVLLDVTVHVDSFANEGVPLTIKTRAGYQYGSNALGGTPIFDGTCPIMEHSMTTPRVLIVHKKYPGPEEETATGPNFPVTYQISVDVANMQVVNNLQVVDCLPGSLTFLSGPVGSTFAGGCLTVSLGTVTGGTTHPDRSFSFQAYVQDLDTTTGLPVLGPSCKTPVPNPATATAQWTPLDVREAGPVTVSAQDVHTITAKCVALQKTVQEVHDTHAPGPTPGDTLQYRLDFEISDFRTFDGIVLDDFLADGLVPVGTPTLTISDKFDSGPPLSGPISPVTSVYQNSSTGDVYTCNDGSKMYQPSHLQFDISGALATLDPTGRHGLGILTGGQAGLPHAGPATGTILFRARIADLYQRQQIPSPRNVKKDDTLPNCPEIHGNLLQNADSPAIPQVVVGSGDDDSLAAVTIVTGILKKVVLAVNGNPPTSIPPLIAPGDNVTFRLQLPIPSSDTTGLAFQDFLPLPIFSAPSGSGLVPCTNSLPPLNGATARPPLCNDPFLAGAGDPIRTPSSGNSLTFNYPSTLSEPNNISQPADLLFTVKASAAPYVDGLHFTNHVLEREKNSFGVEFDQTEVAELVLGEPKLRIRKGVPKTNDPLALFSPNPPVPLGVTFNPPGTSPGFTGVINSNNVGLALNSDVSHVQGCDRVRFVIAVENIGSSPKGAFDVKLADLLPACLKNPSNLRVVNGLGVPFHCNGGLNCSSLAPFFFGGGITLDDTANAGALAPYSPTAGTNIAVITFDATIPCNTAPTGCCTNTGKLLNYAGANGGPNHVTANFSMPFPDTTNPFSDGANVCVQPQIMKSVAAISEPGIPGSQGLPLLIGGVVRYHLQIALPVGVSQNLTFTDTLPPGLVWMPNSFLMPHSCEVTFKDPALILVPPTPVFTGTGFTPALTVNFGMVTNPSGGPNGALLEVECNALVLNSPPGPPPNNHLGDLRPNHFTAKVTPSSGPPVTYTSNIIPAVIAEPAGVLVKQELPSVAPTIATYQLSYTNTGTANAYDIVIQDPVPSSLFVFGVTVTSSSPCTSQVTSSNTVMVTCPVIGPGSSVQLQFSVRGLQLCTPLTNTATLTYTSLPGLHGTVPNTTGGFPPGASGAPRGERVYPSSASVVTTHCPDLAIQKSHDPLLSTSLQGSYTFTVTNVGNAPPTPPETVTDTLPPGVQLVSASGGNGWTCTSSGSTVTCTNPTPIPPGGSSNFQIVVKLTTPAPNGVTNCAAVAAPPELNLANNQGCDTVSTCVPPPAKLMTWYPLDETSVELACDPRFPLASVCGEYVPASGPNAPQPSPGMVANGLCFSGNGSYVDVSGLNDLGGGDLTIDAWVKTTATGGVQPILDKRQDMPDLRGYSLFLVNGQLGFQLANGPGSASCSTSSSSACTNWAATGPQAFVASGQWTFVAVTVQRNQPTGGTFYVNGNAVGTFDPTPRQGSLTNNGDLWLAATHPINGPMTTLRGCLDEVEIFTRALSAQEIQSIYQAGSLGKCKP